MRFDDGREGSTVNKIEQQHTQRSTAPEAKLIEICRVCFSVAALLALGTPFAAYPEPSSAERCTPRVASANVVNVKDKGALGNGRSNDTAALQAAIDAVAGSGGTVFVPDGVYLIDAVTAPRLFSGRT